MSLTTLLVHDVVIVRPGYTTNRYGDLIPDWLAATNTTAKGWITQRPGDEDLLNRDAQVAEWVLFLHAGTSITGHDRVSWEGITFEVAGPPQRAWTPRGEHHVEATLRVVEG